MPTYNRLTDRTQVSGLSLTDIFHVVVTGDTSQSPQGSSYFAPLDFLTPLFSGTGYVNTVENNNGGVYYPNFVDSNNTTPTAESLYTNSGLTYNPLQEILTIGSFVRTGNGNSNNPSFSFNNDTQTGMYLVTPYVLGFSAKNLRNGSFDNFGNFTLGNGDLTNGANFVFQKGGYLATSNNIPQIITQVTLNSDSVYTIHAYVAAGRDTGTNGVGGDIKGTFINTSGVVTQIGSTVSNVQQNVGVGVTFNFNISGSNVEIIVTGFTAININWACKLFYIPQSFTI